MSNAKITRSLTGLRRTVESIDALAMQITLVTGELPFNSSVYQDALKAETLAALFQETLLSKIELLEGLINETNTKELPEKYNRVA